MTRVASSGQGIYGQGEMRGATMFAKLVSLLLVPPPGEPGLSYEDLADLTGLHVHTVRRYLLAMREARPRAAFISGWDLDVRGNPSIRLFRLGRSKDVPRPKMSNAERQRRQKLRKRQQRIQNALAGAPSEQTQ